MQYRAPALSGDVTFLNGEVVALDHDRAGGPIATVKVVMTNQDDTVMAQGKAEIELPTPCDRRRRRAILFTLMLAVGSSSRRTISGACALPRAVWSARSATFSRTDRDRAPLRPLDVSPICGGLCSSPRRRRRDVDVRVPGRPAAP